LNIDSFVLFSLFEQKQPQQTIKEKLLIFEVIDTIAFRVVLCYEEKYIEDFMFLRAKLG
jgi:hypothetical protein